MELSWWKPSWTAADFEAVATRPATGWRWGSPRGAAAGSGAPNPGSQESGVCLSPQLPGSPEVVSMSATREERLAEENRRLRQEPEALQSQAQAFQTQVQELETIRRNLEHTVAVYRRCLFGSRSEKIDPKQLE